MEKHLPRSATPPHIVTLVIASATAAVSMNLFLPSLPGMAEYFQADYRVVQLAVSLYLAATAILQLGIGPASDRFGRRPVMLTSFVIFILATIAALVAPNITIFLICRVMQAFAAAGMVLSRAIVRDTVGADEAASRIGYITMGMTLAPMLGPVIGGFLDELYGWKSTFYLILGFGLISFVVVYLDLGETHHNRSTSLTKQLKTYPELFRARRFWGYTATAGMASGAFFAFLGGGPYVATEILGLTPSQYGLYFIFISVGYMIGNFMSGRYSRRIGINPMMLAGNIVASLGLLLALALFLVGFYHPMSLFGPSFLVGIGNGMTMPNANAGIVSVRPHLAGSASGLGGALQIGGGAALSVLAGALLSPDTGPYPLIWVMLISSSLGIVTSLYVIYVARQVGDV
ncbi:multidrug effflux MFS transporter [Nitratireductor aquimarinus]|uniref:Bcr/CflA family efflux transporter n=1 Tax=Nitratireductor aquimarinus TaxID=889300 RepID=A0ABU4AEM0_9HYPH|nr:MULTISPECIES: multidrug effflux MFS transporter [Alphaproteobacteria]MBY6020914.1 multidrug effflux MFS transporter [Nitratireductor sp. DP7N14-4]MBN7756128.1 multidrug effflux MFS transporter [Nitratireductor aquimarinus]MBN7759613.1 multidrug effflux MFS transporter [Nitratireductor aquibiodomus]MBN7778239.1 multidrug effflux MFS transporter [Nitratireductor pacificus]MBN7782561.1 multidrug effflux MFS transporter [Nitratireductor pacificus]